MIMTTLPNEYSTVGEYGITQLFAPPSSAKGVIIDVVFVHGLTGNRTRTWSHDGLLWPKDLLPKTLPNARIMTFGYDADVLNMWSTAGQNRIGHHGSSLARSLADFRDRTDMSNTPIIFVAHSLGGLVCESAILECKNSAESHLYKIVENTRGIVFMGTPHAGADLANWATLFTNFTNLLRPTNHRIVEVLTPDSEVLAGIQKDFHTMLRARRDTHKPDINIMCFFEELPVAGVGLIVPHRSAILPAYGSQSIHANHMDMPKFSSEQDPGYLAVSTMLWRWQKDIVMYARSLNPREKDRLFRLLVKAAEEGDLAGVTSAIEEGADVNYSDMTGSNHSNIKRSFKNVHPSKIPPSGVEVWKKSTANQYATALQAAVGGGTGIFGFPKHRAQSLKIIQLLLEHKADVNAPGSDYGDALQVAIQTNDIEIVKILLSAGADVKVKRTGGVDCTALMTAASSPWADTTMIKLLLDHGADVNAVGGLGGTALCAAAMGGENKLEVMRVLLAHGAYANMRGGPEARYVNPLHAAVTWKDLSGPPGYPEGVRLLVEHGAQINDLPEQWRSRARKIVDPDGCYVM